MRKRIISIAVAAVMMLTVFGGVGTISANAEVKAPLPTGLRAVHSGWDIAWVAWPTADNKPVGTKTTFKYAIFCNGQAVKSGTETLTAGYLADGDSSLYQVPRYQLRYDRCIPGATYTFQVKQAASDSYYESDWSKQVSVTTDAYKDYRSNKLTAAGKSNSSVQLTFNNSISSAYNTPTGYYIYRSSNKGKSYSKIKTITKAGVTKYTDSKRKFAAGYKYKMIPFKTVGGKTHVAKGNAAVSGMAYAVGGPKVKTKDVIVVKSNGYYRPTDKDYLKITWSKVAKVDGYQVWVTNRNKLGFGKKLSLKKNFSKKSKRQWNINVKKLDCYNWIETRVRAYKIVKGKKVYSTWRSGPDRNFFRG